MKNVFGLSRSKKFTEALDKTFAKFEAMPAKEMFALGMEHSKGDIAAFVSACSSIDTSHHQEISFVFESPDTSLKSFTASFERKSTLCFNTGSSSQDMTAHTNVAANSAYLGAVGAFSAGMLCQAA
ncbi:hypothetical protein [Pseudomonas prosekii]|uniref:hypothetical protein n=1 Tax=Pseudomonas prosekii TaxID=1148509 RepID=UPI0012FD65A4|nr:hypothetical protein [Pseudomonas prosekii]